MPASPRPDIAVKRGGTAMAQTQSTFAIEALLRTIAQPQLGLVTTAQALQRGDLV